MVVNLRHNPVNRGLASWSMYQGPGLGILGIAIMTLDMPLDTRATLEPQGPLFFRGKVWHQLVQSPPHQGFLHLSCGIATVSGSVTPTTDQGGREKRAPRDTIYI